MIHRNSTVPALPSEGNSPDIGGSTYISWLVESSTGTVVYRWHSCHQVTRHIWWRWLHHCTYNAHSRALTKKYILLSLLENSMCPLAARDDPSNFCVCLPTGGGRRLPEVLLVCCLLTRCSSSGVFWPGARRLMTPELLPDAVTV